MKKLFIALTLIATLSAHATWKTEPLFTGLNVLVGSNSIVLFGATNVLFTYNNGGIFYSLTNNTIGGNTNNFGATIFKDIPTVPDANGLVNANMALTLIWNGTNQWPMAGTNALGQFIPTNNWPPSIFGEIGPVQPGGFNPMLPNVTTNYYPAIQPGIITNALTIVLAREVDGVNPGNGPLDTFTWNISVITNQNAMQIQSTNLPTAFTTGARKIRLVSIGASQAASNIVSTNNGTVFNMLSLTQWVP